MELAIEKAEKCVPEDDRTHPRVGAVVVNNNTVLASAYRGEINKGEHAEFTVLEKKLGSDSVVGATVYTTLEPCTSRHHPKLPCADRLIERKVGKVVIGILDPDQHICGRGIRKLRNANIEVELFPTDLMSKVEEQNREFIRDQEKKISSENGSPISCETSEAEYVSQELIEAAGLTGFYPSRRFYVFRRDGSSIDSYVSRAKKSIVMVSINLLTGLSFDNLCSMLENKLSNSGKNLSVVISLLNPSKAELISSISPVLNRTKDQLYTSIKDTIDELAKFRSSLSSGAQSRFDIRVHNAIPFGSAIMIDHREKYGRIQIETKPYKAVLNDAFAFEIAPHGKSNFYQTLVRGYEALLGDGNSIEEVNFD
jgi:pyrimidine deaminase RibD-like protein